MVLESFAEHLRENIGLNPNDDAVWRKFLKDKYGIPSEMNEDTNGQGVQGKVLPNVRETFRPEDQCP
jgi:hypothetical protein